MGRREDLTGQVFGKLTVVSPAPSDTINKKTRWDCTCVCGSECTIYTRQLKYGAIQSCGCDEIHMHGDTGSSEYYTWLNLKSRCNNPNNPEYHNYGGRGIVVSERWNIYSNFLKDMGRKPTPEHSIDREDVDGNYEPSNCRWVNTVTQARNKRIPASNVSGAKGVHWDTERNKWIAKITTAGTIKYLGRFVDVEDAKKARFEAELKYWGEEFVQESLKHFLKPTNKV